VILDLTRPAAGYPLGRAERAAYRAHLRSTMVTTAVRIARLAGRTIVCQGIEHATCAGAAVCLCECHDPRELQP
jgi:hypothetical protein